MYFSLIPNVKWRWMEPRLLKISQDLKPTRPHHIAMQSPHRGNRLVNTWDCLCHTSLLVSFASLFRNFLPWTSVGCKHSCILIFLWTFPYLSSILNDRYFCWIHNCRLIIISLMNILKTVFHYLLTSIGLMEVRRHLTLFFFFYNFIVSKFLPQYVCESY